MRIFEFFETFVFEIKNLCLNLNCNFQYFFTGTWLLMGDSHDPVWRWHSVNALDSAGLKGKPPIGPLGRIQDGLNKIAGHVLPYFKVPNHGACIIAYMEQQVLASQALASSQEYKLWLLQLTNFLSTHGKIFFYTIQ